MNIEDLPLRCRQISTECQLSSSKLVEVRHLPNTTNVPKNHRRSRTGNWNSWKAKWPVLVQRRRVRRSNQLVSRSLFPAAVLEDVRAIQSSRYPSVHVFRPNLPSLLVHEQCKVTRRRREKSPSEVNNRQCSQHPDVGSAPGHQWVIHHHAPQLHAVRYR